ncbi:uncharacterized protein SPSK_05704 [Sporothrix schenckii 1099-18]|uniref:Uncharacterized protein n=1 Tax=Sporothrix schenckii 1099-18 TaxID=1397361 RepID=A0A0F2LUJ3_SPOSC|nr:uncharacterized protein SPSK_05704 [Sporothrix schenckii 1099-18]KJR81137.1 hypothetical protein SPSK_05704 [Sporothrix schenckii 1099-18]
MHGKQVILGRDAGKWYQCKASSESQMGCMLSLLQWRRRRFCQRNGTRPERQRGEASDCRARDNTTEKERTRKDDAEVHSTQREIKSEKSRSKPIKERGNAKTRECVNKKRR